MKRTDKEKLEKNKADQEEKAKKKLEMKADQEGKKVEKKKTGQEKRDRKELDKKADQEEKEKQITK